jgi:hypothetical protein
VLLYPYRERTLFGRVAVEAFGAVVLALASWAVRDSPGPARLAISLAVVASGLSINNAIHPVAALNLAANTAPALFDFWAATSLMVYLLADFRVTTDELYSVGATFTVSAWGFAYVFSVLRQLRPGRFIAAVNPDAPRTWMELLSLSFTNLSSRGPSDRGPSDAAPVTRCAPC